MLSVLSISYLGITFLFHLNSPRPVPQPCPLHYRLQGTTSITSPPVSTAPHVLCYTPRAPRFSLTVWLTAATPWQQKDVSQRTQRARRGSSDAPIRPSSPQSLRYQPPSHLCARAPRVQYTCTPLAPCSLLKQERVETKPVAKALVLGAELVLHILVFARHDEEVDVGPKRQW